MRNCKECIFWPVCEDWSKDYYSMLGGKNPFPLKGDILDECQLYKSNKLYKIKKKVKISKKTEYFGPVLAEIDYYEDDMLDQIYHLMGHKSKTGYVWENNTVLHPCEDYNVTIYKADSEGNITNYFPIDRIERLEHL